MADPNYMVVVSYDQHDGKALVRFGCRTPDDGECYNAAYWLTMTLARANELAERWNIVEAIRRGAIMTIT